MSQRPGSLKKRITLTIITGISVILLSFGIASYFIIQKNITESLNRKLALAHLIRNNIDNIIRDNINRLYDISISGKVDLTDGNYTPEKEAVRTAYRYSIFTDGIFLLDRSGRVLINYPEKVWDASVNAAGFETLSTILLQGKPVVSNVYTVEPSKKKVIFVLVPLKDKRGNYVGAAGGEMDPTNPVLTRMLGLIDMKKSMFIDIVDSNGVVISSSDSSRMLTQCNRNNFFTGMIGAKKERITSCHSCHAGAGGSEKKTMVLAFVPLEMAPWGISIQELEEDVFIPAVKLKRTFAALAAIFIGTAFILTIGISRSIVNPLKELIQGADRIAKGDLSKPVPLQGSDEIGVLSQSFELMRRRLVESMESITRQNQELETRVEERTRQINQSQQRAELLLNKLISSQEDERKRIARELHDATLQDLSALLMKIDMCLLNSQDLSKQKIEAMRTIVINAWDGVLGIIQNLRPTLLDDLGLAAAIKSLLDLHLAEREINYFINTVGVTDRRFRPEVEITLFRIIQEAVLNTARHASAQNVFVLFKIENDAVNLDIEDDGEGFDLNRLYMPLAAGDRRGLGLMGMRERVLQIGGRIEICSMPGLGTRIGIHLPLKVAEACND
jgi:signal transduction histidine kinase